MNYHKDRDHWKRDYSHGNQIFSLNGTGRSGKTTIAEKLEADGKGIRVLPYLLRDRFEKIVYRTLDRTDEERNIDVFGVGGLGWMVAEYHWRIKPFLSKGEIIIFDHYLFDCIVDNLPDFENMDIFAEFVQESALPQINRGNHFFLDIVDYAVYEERANRFEDPSKELNVTPESIFYERRERYLKFCEQKWLIRVDATTSIEETYQEILGYFPRAKRDIE